MEIAFPFILLLLILGPGFIFRIYSQKQEVLQTENISISRASLYSFMAAMTFNSIVIFVISCAGYKINFGDVFSLLTTNNQVVMVQLQQELNNSPSPFFCYFTLTWLLALASAMIWRNTVLKFGWEHVSSPLVRLARGRAPWFYLLHGYDYRDAKCIEGAYVAATVDMGGLTYLYEGLLLDFQLGEDGALDRLILIEAERRLLTDDRQGWPSDDSRFYDISGHYFILKYDQVTTLNVSYLVAVP